MAFLKLMVFSAVAIILASSKKGGKKGGGLRSLTALVEQQTKKISDITREINELKARKNDVMVVKEEIKDLKIKIESLGQTNEEQTGIVDEAKEEIEDLKIKIESLGQTNEEQTGIEKKLVKEIEALKETCGEETKARKNDVMVVSGEEDLREERCAKVCAGTSVRGATFWVNFSDDYILTDVDISKCGFVTIPTVTSSLEGKYLVGITGGSVISRATTSTFRIYLLAPRHRSGVANSKGFNVEWIAVGYTC